MNPGLLHGIVDRHVASTRVVRRDIQRVTDTVFELPVPNGNPARPVRPPRVPPSIKSGRPAWIASRNLPNRRRIVLSDGRMAASVQLSAVGSEPCSAPNSRRAATRLLDPGIGQVGQWDRVAGEYAGWVRIVGT